MPIDTSTLGTQSPRTEDGRVYPPYLRAFERFDSEFLAKVQELDEPTLNVLSLKAPTSQLRSAVSPWIASAEWRGLIERVDANELVGKRRYRLTERGKAKLAEPS
ncbi:MAG TPA: hypothetical protein VMG80_04935 [Solirubrobacteraceae bacterium]|nr:hypothetical protein [Solirubrobacteraceae bacterium]